MANKTSKAVTEKDGLSKREKAIAAAAPKTSSVTSRAPQHELQVYYIRSKKGGLAQRHRLVPVGTEIPGI